MKKVFGLVMVGAALMVTGCNRGAAEPGSQTTVTEDITATLQSPATTISALGKVSVLANAPVGADKKFTLKLPTSGKALEENMISAQNMLDSLQCTQVGNNPLKISDASTQVVPALSLNADKRQVFAVVDTSKGLTSRSLSLDGWVYSNKATIIEGKVDCKKLINISAITALPVDVNVNLQPGWNVVRLNITASIGLSGVTANGELGGQKSPIPTITYMDANELGAAIQ